MGHSQGLGRRLSSDPSLDFQLQKDRFTLRIVINYRPCGELNARTW
jgi:hypothetical protein